MLAVAVAAASVRILREYERAVVFRLGRLIGAKGPGVVLLVPLIDRMVRVSLRTQTLNIPAQDVITCDNVPARVDAVAYFRVVDPRSSIVEIENFRQATSLIAQTTLRAVLGKADLDALLSQREQLNERCSRSSTSRRSPGGSRSRPSRSATSASRPRCSARWRKQAEAERERRAKVIKADAEAQAAVRLSEAADVISRNPATLQLRYLQTLSEIGIEQNSTVVFPLPMDLVTPLLGAVERSRAELERADGEPRLFAPREREHAT